MQRLLTRADLLPKVRAQAHAAVRFGERTQSPWADPVDELARLLVDARIVTRVLESGAADRAQRSAQEQARALLDAEVDLAPQRRDAAVEAAGALARMQCLAAALRSPAYAQLVCAQAERLRSRPPDESAHPLTPAVRSAARAAALARAGAVALRDRRPQLRPATLRRDRARRLRITELVDRLVTGADRSGASGAPLRPPGNDDLLAWLRGMVLDQRLHEPVAEDAAARAWIGADLYGHRQPAACPEFLAGVDMGSLPAELVAPFLRRLSLTRATPSPAELTLPALARFRGEVSRADRDRRARAWAGDLTGPVPLPALAEIPRVVHGIWLGRPLPERSAFWRNYGDLADAYAGQLDVVLWTDLSRRDLDSPAAAHMVDWARTHGIHLVNVTEVFHAGEPMLLASPFAMELGRGSPAGFAAASDHLRVELVYRFGGLYADGDLTFAPEGIPDLLDHVAASASGLTLNTLGDAVWNDLIAAPARHPALALWREIARLNYLRSVVQLNGGTANLGPRGSAWTWALTPARSGRMHHRMLHRLGVPITGLVPVRPAITGGSELSWVAPRTGEPPVPHPAGADVLPVLQRGIAYLRWQLQARLGDLHLSGFDPVIRGLPAPPDAWAVLLEALPELSRDLRTVASVTVTRRYDNGLMRHVALAPPTQALLRRSTRPWLGTGHDAGRGYLWFLDEFVVPASLARPD